MEKTYQLGFSKQQINPTLPVKLSGYYPMRTADSIHDDLWVRTHVFLNQTTGEMVVFSSFDVVAVDVKLKECVEKALKQKFPGYTHHVFVSATHTHSAPAGTLKTTNGVKQSFIDIFGELNETYFSYCVEQCVWTIEEAINTATDFQYRFLMEKVADVGTDRHDPKNEGDPRLLVLEFTLASQIKSLLYLYSCHPTVLNQGNTHISADLPWGVTRLLEEEYPVVQFLNGNISTRFTRQAADFTQIKRFGKKLATTILNVQKEPPKELDRIRVWTNSAVLETKDRGDAYLELIDATFLEEINELRLDYAIIQFGSLFFLTIPGEITSDLTRELRKKYPTLFILGYTNDYLFYFASENLYEADAYEALSSFLKKGEMEQFMTTILKEMEGIL